MRPCDTRDGKLLDLFEFYMSVNFGRTVAAVGCPFPIHRSRGWSCHELCDQFFGTGFSCPCCALGHRIAMATLEALLVKEGFIPDESR
jgi:hypothetical protein